MYTKNPITGRNETLVNTSMLNGAINGVATKINGKAGQGALDSLSEYAVGIALSIAGKADESDVQTLSEYVEGRLPKSVYDTMVDAYVGLACKVADSDVLEGAAKMAYAANPEKYATSNPADDGCASVTAETYKSPNPIYDAVNREVEKAQGGDITVSLPPFLRLTTFAGNSSHPVVDPSVRGKLKTWTTGLPNLTNGTYMFRGAGLTSWTVELPNLTDGTGMFFGTAIEEWTVELPNLTDGQAMFQSTELTSWTTELPNLTNALDMFSGTGLTSWDVELPNLTNGGWMFGNTSIEEWTVELPNLTNGASMFASGSMYDPDAPAALKRFRGTLPSLTSGNMMFMNCQLDLESIRCIAETINDVNDPSISADKKIDICLATGVIDEPAFSGYVNAIKEKGWMVVVNGEDA